MPSVPVSRVEWRRLRTPALFESAKTLQPIPSPSDAHYQAMVQATLDASVLQMEPGPVIALGSGQSAHQHQTTALISADASRTALYVVSPGDKPPEPQEIEEASERFRITGCLYQVLTPADVRREPLYSNSKLVWECRSQRVAAGDRIRILHVLTESGPLPLIETASAALRTSDAVAVVLALACQGLVEIDLAVGPLGPETQVRRGMLSKVSGGGTAQI